MKKAELEKLTEKLAHTLNAMRSELLDHVDTPHDENDFWSCINQLPAEMRESVIN